MFCRNCGKEMRDGSAFCPNCGTMVTSASPGETASGAAEPAVSASDPVLSSAGGGKRRGLDLLIGGGVAAVALIAVMVVTVSGMFTSPKGKVEKAFTKTTDTYQDAGGKVLELPDLKNLRTSCSQRMRVELKSVNSQLTGGYDLSPLYGLGLRMSGNYDQKGRKLDAQVTAFWDEDDLVSGQLLLDNDKLYLGSPQFTGGTFLGLSTETLGDDLADLTDDDSVEDISFNVFDIMDIVLKRTEPDKDREKAVKDANKALKAAVEVKKTGSKTMDINGKSTKTTAYHVIVPQDALEDYVDAMEDILSSMDLVDMYEEIFKAVGVPKDEIDYMMSSLDGDIYGDLADGVKDILDELGDIELDVYLSGGRVSAVIYEEKIQGTKVEIALYLGGGENYEDNLSLEIKAAGGEILVESSGNHTGKGGKFTDETTVRVRSGGSSMGRLTSEISYEPKGKGNNFHWEVGVDSSGASLGVLEMDGALATTKDSLDLKLEELSVRTMGIEMASLGLEYYVGPCKGMEVSVKSPEMLADMDMDDLMDLAYDLQSNAQDWALDMQDLFGSRVSEELLWALGRIF